MSKYVVAIVAGLFVAAVVGVLAWASPNLIWGGDLGGPVLAAVFAGLVTVCVVVSAAGNEGRGEASAGQRWRRGRGSASRRAKREPER